MTTGFIFRIIAFQSNLKLINKTPKKMKRMLFLCLVAVVAATGSVFITGCKSNKPAQARQIPLEDFFKNPERVRYQISPDGKYYSFLAPWENRMNIFVQEIGKDSAVRLTSEKDRDISDYFWKNPTRLLFLRDTGGDENFRLYGVNVDGSNLICFTDFPKVRTEVINSLDDFPNEVIIGLNKRNDQVFDPYRLNIETGAMTMLAENPGNIQGWYLDHDGKLRLATAIVDGVNTQILYREKETDKFKPVLTTSFKESMSPQFFTFDNKYIYASSNLGRDKSAIVIFDPATGKEMEVLYENPDYDVDQLAYSEKRKVLTNATWDAVKRDRHFFDEQTKKIYDRIQNELQGYEINLSSSTKAEDKFIVRTTATVHWADITSMT